MTLWKNRRILELIRNDWTKAGKSEKYMKEVINYIIRSAGSPISWNGISSETGINSPHTAKSYVELLVDMFVVNILHFFSPKGKVMYRKNKKIHFSDPFLYVFFPNTLKRSMIFLKFMKEL